MIKELDAAPGKVSSQIVLMDASDYTTTPTKHQCRKDPNMIHGQVLAFELNLSLLQRLRGEIVPAYFKRV